MRPDKQQEVKMTTFSAKCDQCGKTFERESKMDARASLQSHVNKTRHQSAVAAVAVREKGATVANGAQAVAEPTDIDEARKAKAAAKAEADAEKARKREEREAAAKAKREAEEQAKAERAKAREEARLARLAPRTEPCECGCGLIPAGRKSRFLPGHDARHYSAIRKENGVQEAAATK